MCNGVGDLTIAYYVRYARYSKYVGKYVKAWVIEITFREFPFENPVILSGQYCLALIKVFSFLFQFIVEGD